MSIKGIYDIHCHIVPGVDDGATDIGETVKLLRMEYEQGVRTVIATPHFRFRMFETPAEKVREQFRLVEKAASEISPDLHVYLGCEFHANMEMLPMLREQKVMTMAGSRYVLTEFSHNSEESYIRERLGALLSGGYKPIMAHIERYEATRNSLDFVEELADMGVYMQINADSITGKDGFFTKRYCNKIMKDGLLHFVGSDCHNSAKRSSRIGFEQEEWHLSPKSIANKLQYEIHKSIAIDTWGLYLLAVEEKLDLLERFDQIYVTHFSVSRMLEEITHFKNENMEVILAYLESAEHVKLQSPNFEVQLKVRENVNYYEPCSTIAMAVEAEIPAIIGETMLAQNLIDRFKNYIVRPDELEEMMGIACNSCFVREYQNNKG